MSNFARFCQNTGSLQRRFSPNFNHNKEQAMASDLIKHTTDATFETDVLKADKPVIVDFGLSGAVLAR